MVTVHKEHSGMMVMYFTCHYIDMKEEHSTPTAISDLSTWSVMVKVSASKWCIIFPFIQKRECKRSYLLGPGLSTSPGLDRVSVMPTISMLSSGSSCQ